MEDVLPLIQLREDDKRETSKDNSASPSLPGTMESTTDDDNNKTDEQTEETILSGDLQPNSVILAGSETQPENIEKQTILVNTDNAQIETMNTITVSPQNDIPIGNDGVAFLLDDGSVLPMNEDGAVMMTVLNDENGAITMGVANDTHNNNPPNSEAYNTVTLVMNEDGSLGKKCPSVHVTQSDTSGHVSNHTGMSPVTSKTDQNEGKDDSQVLDSSYPSSYEVLESKSGNAAVLYRESATSHEDAIPASEGRTAPLTKSDGSIIMVTESDAAVMKSDNVIMVTESDTSFSKSDNIAWVTENDALLTKNESVARVLESDNFDMVTENDASVTKNENNINVVTTSDTKVTEEDRSVVMATEETAETTDYSTFFVIPETPSGNDEKNIEPVLTKDATKRPTESDNSLNPEVPPKKSRNESSPSSNVTVMTTTQQMLPSDFYFQYHDDDSEDGSTGSSDKPTRPYGIKEDVNWTPWHLVLSKTDPGDGNFKKRKNKQPGYVRTSTLFFEDKSDHFCRHWCLYEFAVKVPGVESYYIVLLSQGFTKPRGNFSDVALYFPLNTIKYLLEEDCSFYLRRARLMQWNPCEEKEQMKRMKGLKQHLQSENNYIWNSGTGNKSIDKHKICVNGITLTKQEEPPRRIRKGSKAYCCFDD